MPKALTRLILSLATACALLAVGFSVLSLGGSAAFFSFGGSAALAQAMDDPQTPNEAWTIVRGGQLYDKWWNVLYLPEPEETHPAYTAEGAKSGSTTWRCKECHGWDYRGVDGAYAKGSHFTGIGGIRDFVGVNPDEIAAALVAPPHRFTDGVLPKDAINALALFVSKGQIDTAPYINAATKTALGNADRGGAIFQTVCAVCHGLDGAEMNFGDAVNPLYVGTLANDNPWEILHKIRFGHPGAPMVALFALDIEDQVDVLTYLQLLP